jgi:hypothetical protein
MSNTPRPATRRPGPHVSSDIVRGIPLAIYSVVGGVVAVGVSTSVIRWLGGNPLDWLTVLIILVFASGWYAPSVLRWLLWWRR